MPGIYNPGGGAPTGPAGGDLGGTYPNPTVDNAANIPSGDEKAALAGTSGAPAAGNKYVTDADARNSNARTPATHDNSVHSAGLRSTSVGGSRTAAAGAGTQSITGAGFTPTGIVVIALVDAGALACVGFSDDANLEEGWRFRTATAFDYFNGVVISLSDGVNAMEATATLTADGVDLVWSKSGAGVNVTFSILFLR